jgi:hypothetical protein
MKLSKRKNLTMTWLAASLLLALLSFASVSTSQQTAFITELPAYSSLPQCGAIAVSAAADQISNLWCSAIFSPVPLASCICLNPSFSAAASREISEGVVLVCTAELSSALGVLTTYCAAASQNDIESQTTGTAAAGSASTSGSVSDSPSMSLSTPSSSPTQTDSGGGMGLSNQIALGTGIGIGAPTIIVAIIAAYFAYPAFKRMREERVDGE